MFFFCFCFRFVALTQREKENNCKIACRRPCEILNLTFRLLHHINIQLRKQNKTSNLQREHELRKQIYWHDMKCSPRVNRFKCVDSEFVKVLSDGGFDENKLVHVLITDVSNFISRYVFFDKLHQNYVIPFKVVINAENCANSTNRQFHHTYFLIIVSGSECLRRNNLVCGFFALFCCIVLPNAILTVCLSIRRLLCVIII